jgi:hypothetical protein
MSGGSCRTAYLAVNTELTVNLVYVSDAAEHERHSFTRFRLGSHRMHYETGRWARIPADQRMCLCGQVQNQGHFLLHCDRTSQLRDELNIQADISNDIFDWTLIDALTAFTYCHEILKIFT